MYFLFNEFIGSRYLYMFLLDVPEWIDRMTHGTDLKGERYANDSWH